MKKVEVEKIWNDIVSQTSKRSKGSFKRALWYGTNIRGVGQIKGLRNQPKRLIVNTINYYIPSVIPAMTILFMDTVNTALDAIINNVVGNCDLKIKPQIVHNLYVKVENSVEDMKSNTFKVIDRNLVKLKDSGNKVNPAIQGLMAAGADMNYQNSSAGIAMGRSPDSDKQAIKADEALRSIAETEHYINKEIVLVKALQTTLNNLENDLNKMQTATQKTRKEVMNYIELALD